MAHLHSAERPEFDSALYDSAGEIVSVGKAVLPDDEGKTTFRPTDACTLEQIEGGASELAVVSAAHRFRIASIALCPTPGHVHFHLSVLR